MHINGRTAVHGIPRHLHCSCTQIPHWCRRSSQGRQRPSKGTRKGMHQKRSRCKRQARSSLAWHFLSFSCHPALQLAQWLSTWRLLC